MSRNGIGFDIVVVGSCCSVLETFATHLPSKGETLRGHGHRSHCAGQGANQAVCAARLGCRTAILCKLGDDCYGHAHLENFRREAVNTRYSTMTRAAPTGVANVVVDDSGGKTVLHSPGANKRLGVKDVFGAAPSHFSGSRVLLVGLEIHPEVALYALKLASDHEMVTIFAPTSAVPRLDEELFRNCDWIIPNRRAVEALFEVPVRTVDDAKAATKRLREKRCKNVIITVGAEGVVFLTEHSKSPVHIPAPSIDQKSVVDTSGAGDAFAGSFAYFVAKSEARQSRDLDHLYAIISKSCAVATFSVQRVGTMSSYPSRAEIKLVDLA